MRLACSARPPAGRAAGAAHRRPATAPGGGGVRPDGIRAAAASPAVAAARPLAARRCTTIVALAAPADAAAPPPVPPASVAVILLAGGSGKRMGAPTPKQYLPLRGKPMAAHSLAAFAAMPEVRQIVIVCDPSYRSLFEDALAGLPAPVPPVAWAAPGAERQDSVCAGLDAVAPGAALVAVHDSARPVVSPADVRRCLADGAAVGAAVLGVPVKPTIKEVNDDGTVARTLDRARLWEVQTPQVVRPDLLRAGFEAAAAGGWAVTDDVSLIEGLGLPVRVTPGSYTNIKCTTPDDMSIAERFLDEAAEAAAKEAVAARAA